MHIPTLNQVHVKFLTVSLLKSVIYIMALRIASINDATTGVMPLNYIYTNVYE